jgi:hypothetical protein
MQQPKVNVRPARCFRGPHPRTAAIGFGRDLRAHRATASGDVATASYVFVTLTQWPQSPAVSIPGAGNIMHCRTFFMRRRLAVAHQLRGSPCRVVQGLDPCRKSHERALYHGAERLFANVPAVRCGCWSIPRDGHTIARHVRHCLILQIQKASARPNACFLDNYIPNFSTATSHYLLCF